MSGPPPAAGSPDDRARLRFGVISATAVLAVVAVAAWVVPAHSGQDLGAAGPVAVCVARDGDPAERDAVIGAPALRASRDLRITAVRLVDPTNVALADTIVVPVVQGPDGGYTLFGAQRGWPLSDAERAGLTVDWAAERPAVGAALTPDVEEAMALHVQVGDPARDASYAGFEVEYRMLATRWVQGYPHAFLMPGGLATCPG